jgi:SpoVK/Ycf46/Vps4 family AAA+-type ATPase
MSDPEFEKAKKYFHEDQYDKALKCCFRLLKKAGNKPERDILMHMALCYYFKDDYKEAFRCMNQAREESPLSCGQESFFLKSAICSGKVKDAEKLLGDCAIGQVNLELYAKILDECLQAGKDREALEYSEKLLPCLVKDEHGKSFKPFILFYRLNETGRAMKWLDRLQRKFTEQDEYWNSLRADFLLKKGEYLGALASIRKRKTVFDAQAEFRHGAAYLGMNDLKKALKHLRDYEVESYTDQTYASWYCPAPLSAAATYNPYDWDFQEKDRVLGTATFIALMFNGAYSRAGKYLECVRAYPQSSPLYADLLNLQGIHCFYLNEHRKALKLFSRSIALLGRADIYLNRCITLFALGKDGKAIEDLQKAYKLAFPAEPAPTKDALGRLGNQDFLMKEGGLWPIFVGYKEVAHLLKFAEATSEGQRWVILQEHIEEGEYETAMQICTNWQSKDPKTTQKIEELRKLMDDARKKRENADNIEKWLGHKDLILEPVYESHAGSKVVDKNASGIPPYAVSRYAINYYNTANAHYKQGDYNAAIENYNMAILLSPRFTEAYFNRGNAYCRLGIYEPAARDFTSAHCFGKTVCRNYNNRGCAQYGNGQPKYAVWDFDKAISMKADYLPGLYNRGMAHTVLKEYWKAIDDFTAAIKIKPSAESYFRRALAYEFNGNQAAAKADCEKALSLKPEMAEAKEKLEQLKAPALQPMLQTTVNSELMDAGSSRCTPAVNFSHVGGMERMKKLASTNLLYPLQQKEKAAAYGKRFGGGILLYGPPGCGKSFIVEAMAGEAGLGLIKANIADILNMYVGNSEKNLRLLFEEARKNQPCILFFDEVEALGGTREGMHQHWEKTLVNQFLMEMDQLEKKKEQVLVIGATNAPWEVDHALRRSGRFTGIVFIEPPDSNARKELFRLYTKDIRMVGDLDYAGLAGQTAGFSCANIKAICEKARDIAWTDAVERGIDRKVSMDDFLKVMAEEKSDVKEWFEIARKGMDNPLFRETYKELGSYLGKSSGRDRMFG